MAAHDAAANLEVLLLGPLARPDHPLQAARIGGERLLHEHVDASLDGVVEVDLAECRVRREQRHVAGAGAEAIDGLPVGVEAQELPLGRDIDLVGMPLAERLVRSAELVLEQVGHGIQLGLPAGDRQGVSHRAAPAVAAADDRQPDRAILLGMHRRDGHACQRGTRGDLPAQLQELPTRGLPRPIMRGLRMSFHGCSLLGDSHLRVRRAAPRW